jgi:RNA polymerase sigma factor (sigma-70 family)
MYGKANQKQMNQRSANEDLLLELYPELKRYCFFLTKNEWDGNDVAQETMVKAFQSYRDHAVITKALLHKIAYHQWIDITRSRQKELVSLPTEAGTHCQKNLLETAETIVERLTPKQALIFTLKEGFQYKLNEIADLTETTDTAVKSILHRAKDRLQKEHISAESYWNDEERQTFSLLLKRSLAVGDPSILIEAAVSIIGVNKKSFVLPVKKQPKSSPSFSLYMAA